MGHVLVLGGARSGKTGFAERLAMRAGERPLYLATAQALDAEMRDRVLLHQQQRHKRFSTIEEPIALIWMYEPAFGLVARFQGKPRVLRIRPLSLSNTA